MAEQSLPIAQLDGATTACSTVRGLEDQPMRYIAAALAFLWTTAAMAEGFTVVSTSESASVLPSKTHYVGLACPAGMKVVGGGFEESGDLKVLAVRSSGPYSDGTGWGVQVVNIGTVEVTSTLQVFAYCTDFPVTLSPKK